MTNEELKLKSIRKKREENAAFFSNKGKSAREKWIVGSFLSKIGVDFNESEIEKEKDDSLVDIKFRDANFQIKEITDPNITRTKDARLYKEYGDKAESLAEINPPLVAKNIPDVIFGNDLIIKEVNNYSTEEKYPLKLREKLDLLIYITRTRVSYFSNNEELNKSLKTFGWRSVSILMNDKAEVVYRSGAVPDFKLPKIF